MTAAQSGLSLVVMAAGLGSRYGGLKQVEPVGPNGEWIIDYSVFDALRAGFERVLFVVRDDVEAVLRARFEDALEARCDVDYVSQRIDDLPEAWSRSIDRTKPWGTGHAVLACRDRLDGPFVVINADDFYGAGGYRDLARFLAEPGDEHALVGYPLAQTMTEFGTVSRGICLVDERNRLVEIAERKRVTFREGGMAYTEDDVTWHPIEAGAIASMNMWGFRASLLGDLEDAFEVFLGTDPSPQDEFCLPEVIARLMAEGKARVRVFPTQDPWFGVTYRDDLPRARLGIDRLVRAGVYPTPLWRGDGHD